MKSYQFSSTQMFVLITNSCPNTCHNETFELCFFSPLSLCVCGWFGACVSVLTPKPNILMKFEPVLLQSGVKV